MLISHQDKANSPLDSNPAMGDVMGGTAEGLATLLPAVGLPGMGNPHRLTSVKPGRMAQGEAQQRGLIQILLPHVVAASTIPSAPCPSHPPKSPSYEGSQNAFLAWKGLGKGPAGLGAPEPPRHGSPACTASGNHLSEPRNQTPLSQGAAFGAQHQEASQWLQPKAALAFAPIIPGRLPQAPASKALPCPLPAWPWAPAPRCQRAGPTPRTTQRGCRQEPKPGIMICTKDNDSESCYWLFSKRNSFLLEN